MAIIIGSVCAVIASVILLIAVLCCVKRYKQKIIVIEKQVKSNVLGSIIKKKKILKTIYVRHV